MLKAFKSTPMPLTKKSEDKTVAANAAFVAANKARAEAVYGSFVTLGL